MIESLATIVINIIKIIPILSNLLIKLDIQLMKSSYTIEENGDVIIWATIRVTNTNDTHIPITSTSINVRYNTLNDNIHRIYGYIMGHSLNFIPQNIPPHHAVLFDVSYIIPSDRMRDILKESKNMMGNIKESELEIILERCDFLIFQFFSESEESKSEKRNSFEYWERPIVIQFEFFYSRNGFVCFNAPVQRADVKTPPYIAWQYVDRSPFKIGKVKTNRIIIVHQLSYTMESIPLEIVQEQEDEDHKDRA